MTTIFVTSDLHLGLADLELRVIAELLSLLEEPSLEEQHARISAEYTANVERLNAMTQAHEELQVFGLAEIFMPNFYSVAEALGEHIFELRDQMLDLEEQMEPQVIAFDLEAGGLCTSFDELFKNAKGYIPMEKEENWVEPLLQGFAEAFFGQLNYVHDEPFEDEDETAEMIIEIAQEVSEMDLEEGEVACYDIFLEEGDDEERIVSRLTAALPDVKFSFKPYVAEPEIKAAGGDSLEACVAAMAADCPDVLAVKSITIVDSAIPESVDPETFIDALLDVFSNATVSYRDEEHTVDFVEEVDVKETAGDRVDRKLAELDAKFGDKGPKCLDIYETADKTSDYVSDLVVAIHRKYPETAIKVEGAYINLG